MRNPLFVLLFTADSLFFNLIRYSLIGTYQFQEHCSNRCKAYTDYFDYLLFRHKW